MLSELRSFELSLREREMEEGGGGGDTEAGIAL